MAPKVGADWTIKLPNPIAVPGKRKALRTLGDAANYMLDDLPKEQQEGHLWQVTAGAVNDAAEGRVTPARAEIAFRMALFLLPPK